MLFRHPCCDPLREAAAAAPLSSSLVIITVRIITVVQVKCCFSVFYYYYYYEEVAPPPTFQLELTSLLRLHLARSLAPSGDGGGGVCVRAQQRC